MLRTLSDSPRPILFFKATASRCVGPDGPITVRTDSRLTQPEAELAVILGTEGSLLGFTACNDVSAWDLLQENPLFLAQAKIFRGCCALGPCLVTPDEIGDPYRLQVRCSIRRDDRTIFSEAASTAGLQHRLEELASWLVRDNPVPPGTVLTTGTGIFVPPALALREGDWVDVEVQGIGRLSNPVRPRCSGRRWP
jgi:2-dehydro-3-deoxy-D-arabinonate dehydratase